MLVACERQNILKALIPADVVGTLYPFLSARGEVDFPMSSKVPPIAWTGPAATLQWKTAAYSESHPLNKKLVLEIKAEHVDLDTDLRVTDDEAIHCLFCDAHGAFDNESAFLWAAEQGLTLLILSLIQNPSRLHYKSQWTLHLWRRALTKATTNGHDVTAALLLKEPINKRTQDD